MTIKDTLSSLRLRHWVKNLLVFVPIIFGVSLFEPHLLLKAVAAFFVFGFASSGVYVLNDLFDKGNDAFHPRKKHRPIAAGRITGGEAFALSSSLFAVALVSAWFLEFPFFIAVALFLLLNITYSAWLKHMFLLDVLSITVSFVLRVYGGGAALGLEITNWLFVNTFLIALVLALGKRREEAIELGGEAGSHRRVLVSYTPRFLNYAIAMAATASFIAYALYTVSLDAVTKFGSAKLSFAVPIVALGLGRYLYIAIKENRGSPTEVLFRDKLLFTTVVAWGLLTIGMIYI